MRPIESPRHPRAREAGAIVALTVLAAVLRSLAWSRTGALFNDGPIFLGLAQLMDEGLYAQAVAHPYHPLYPLAARAVHVGFASWETAAVSVSVLAGAASVPLLYALLRSISGVRLAAVAAFVLAVHPYAVAHSSDVQSDGLYLALFLAAAALLWRAVRSTRASVAAVAGVASGLAYLARPEGLGVAAFGILWALSPGMRAPLRRRVLWLTALAAGAALVTAPYLGALRAQHGSWVLTGKKSLARLGGLDVDGPQGAMSGWLDAARGAELVARRPFLETVVGGPRVPEASPTPSPVATTEPGLAGLALLAGALLAAGRPEIAVLFGIGMWRRRGQGGRGGIFLAGLAASYLLLLAGHALEAGYVSKRHVLPVVALGFGGVAAGAVALAEWAIAGVRRSAKAPAPAFSTALAMLGIALVAAPKTLGPRRDERVAVRRAAEWVRQQPDRGAGVAAGKQRVAYYADAPFVPLPGPNPDPLLAYLRASGARYVIVDEQRIDSDPALRRASREGLRLLHRVRSGGRRAVVFGLDPEERLSARGG